MTVQSPRSRFRWAALPVVAVLGCLGTVLGIQLSSAFASDTPPPLCTDAISCGIEPVPDNVPPGDDEGEIVEGESDDDLEAPEETLSQPEEEGDDAPASPPATPPSGEGDTPEPSPADDPSPTGSPDGSEPEHQPKPQPQPAPIVPLPAPAPPPPPPKPPEEPGIALCAPTPVTRADGTTGRFWQAAASQVPDLLKQGYTPAIYVEGIGTTCSLNNAGVNPNDYVLDVSVLYTDGGIACPANMAAAMCGDSAIHPFYRKK